MEMYKDSFEYRTEDSEDFLEVLAKMEEGAEWIETSSKNISVLPVTDKEVQKAVSPEILEDTEVASKLAICLTADTGKTHLCVRRQGVRSLHDRAGINGDAYRQNTMSETMRASHLNDGIYVMPESLVKVRVECGKVLAIHSSRYEPFSMADAFSEALTYIESHFPDCTFKWGRISHTDCSIGLSFEAYNTTLFKDVVAFVEDENIVPVLAISMGDSAQNAILLTPTILSKGITLPLGDGMSILHRKGENVNEQFRKHLKMVQAQFEQPLKKLEPLKKQVIKYPVEAFRHACKELSLDKKFVIATKLAEKDFETEVVLPKLLASEPVTAWDVYRAMATIPEKVRERTPENKTAIFNCSQMVSRVLSRTNWTRMDYPGGKE